MQKYWSCRECIDEHGKAIRTYGFGRDINDCINKAKASCTEGKMVLKRLWTIFMPADEPVARLVFGDVAAGSPVEKQLDEVSASMHKTYKSKMTPKKKPPAKPAPKPRIRIKNEEAPWYIPYHIQNSLKYKPAEEAHE